MKKSLITLVSLALLVLFASTYSSNAVDAEVGRLAPSFEIQNDSSSFSLGKAKGKYVLLSLWTSADADSRMRNMEYDSHFNDNDVSSMSLISVNFDRNETIYREIARRDNLKAGSHFYDRDGHNSDIYQQYHLNEGYNAFLIAPSGKIIAVNPDLKTLTTILRR